MGLDARKGVCPECKEVRMLRSRGLCKACYATPEVRAKYEPIRNRRFRDLTGSKFGRLTVESAGDGVDEFGKRTWNCICECGGVRVLSTGALMSGNSKSCGCWKLESTGNRARTHGMSKTAIYRIWCLMKFRCYNESNPDFPHYGGRGISICERWRESFESFVEDMGHRPSAKHSIDRIDNNGNYEPENCRWALQVQQTRNKRNNHLLTHNGETLTIAEWAERTGINQRTIQRRVGRGWTTREALETVGRAHRFRSPILERKSPRSKVNQGEP